MKILIVHNEYQQAGGEHVAVEAEISLIRQHDQEVSLYLKDNQEIETYTPLQKLMFVPRVFFSLETYKHIRRIVSDTRPDVAHIHNVFPLISPAVYYALKDSAIPIVQTLHNFRFLCPNGLFYTKGKVCELCKFGNTVYAIIFKCYRNSYSMSALYAFTIGLHRRLRIFQMIDRFIALTDFTAKKMIESGLATRDKITILGNFLLDTNYEKKTLQDSRPYIVYLGRLSPEKGVDILIRAMSGISGMDLKIAGEGSQERELKELAQKISLANVTFLGKVTGSPKWVLIQNAIALIVPSVVYENFPLTILESMSAGIPVIAAKIGCLPYIIEDAYTGLLFEPGNSDDLREKLLWLTNHPNETKELGRNGSKQFHEKNNTEAHYDKLMNIYKEVIVGKKLYNGEI